MKKPFWIIVVVVAGFLGFMMGYSFPPFQQVDFAGGGKSMKASATKIDKEVLDHYKDLYKEDE